MIWKDIPNWPGYMASDTGLIRSTPRTMIRSNGRKYTNSDRILKSSVAQGYKFVGLNKDLCCTRISVHKLVAMTFLAPKHGHKEVNHKNYDKLDNRVENLEYVSTRENVSHSKKRLNKTSIYTGVSFSKSHNRWWSYIGTPEGKNKFLGLFDTEIEASKAYQKELETLGLKNKYT
jgi:hypothetical protein